MDEARLKARMERCQQTSTPGPGAYDARLPHSISNSNTVRPARITKPPYTTPCSCGRPCTVAAQNGRPSSAFKSTTKRGKDELAFMSDPGSYNAHTTTDIGTMSQKSLSTSTLSGAGGFGSSSKARQELVQAGDAASPGPGAYTVRKPSKPEAKQSSAFASKSTRGQYTKSSDAPGVGSYEPILHQPAVLGCQSAFKGGGQRFKTDTSGSHIGPGSYNTYSNNTITAKASADVGKVSSAFASTTLRDGFLAVC